MKIIIVGAIGQKAKQSYLAEVIEILKEHRPDLEVEYNALPQVSGAGRGVYAAYKDEVISAENKEKLIQFINAIMPQVPTDQLTLMIKAPPITPIIWETEKKRTKGHERDYKYHR